MSVNLSVKVSDDVARGLRNRATRNQRSLQEELLIILREAARGQEAVSIDVLMEAAQRKKPALDEAANKISAAKDAEQKRATQRFQDLLGKPEEEESGSD
jgi:plasmid stability protein